MKTTKRIQKRVLCGLLLSVLFAVVALGGFLGYTPTAKADESTYTTENTDVYKIISHSGVEFLALTNYDYQDSSLVDLGQYRDIIKGFNTFDYIVADGKTLTESGKSEASIYLNLFNKFPGSFCFTTGATQSITIKKGCQFPSLAYMQGDTAATVYVTTQDATFMKNADASWARTYTGGTETLITSVDGLSGTDMAFTLSVHDYGAQANQELNQIENYKIKLDSLNMLSYIQLNGHSLDGSQDKDERLSFAKFISQPRFNMFGGVGRFSFRVKRDSYTAAEGDTLFIKAGCQFPSKAYMDGTSDLFYITPADRTFVYTSGVWQLQTSTEEITEDITLTGGFSSHYTEIGILFNQGEFLSSSIYVNNNPGECGADVMQWIVIGKDGQEKTLRQLIDANESGETSFGDTSYEPPFNNGGKFAPVCVLTYKDRILVRILKDYGLEGTYTVTIKNGFSVTNAKTATSYTVGRDLVLASKKSDHGYYSFASTVTWNVEGVTTAEWVANGDMPVYSGETPVKPSTDTTDYTFSGWDKELAAVTGDVTYTAQFTASARKYTVSFVDENGETILHSAEVANGALITKPADPQKASTDEYEYTFDGWYTADDEKWVFDTNKMPIADTTLKAKYMQSERLYRVYFTDDEGNTYTDTAYATQALKYNGVAIKPVDPVKDSTAAQVFTFAGWYSGETEWDFATQVTQDVTLQAKFTAATRRYDVTITFDGLENDKQDVVKKADYNSILDLSEYNETGYGFTATANGDPIDGKSYTVTGDVTIAIIYEVGKYVVTFTVEGLTVRPSSLPEKTELSQGQKLLLGDYSVLDYTYKIYLGEQEITATEVDVQSDITLRVVYTAVPDDKDDNPGNTGDDNGDNTDGNDKKGCGSAMAGGSIAGGGALLLLVAVLLRKRKSAPIE